LLGFVSKKEMRLWRMAAAYAVFALFPAFLLGDFVFQGE
jgi:hypothetical protein